MNENRDHDERDIKMVEDKQPQEKAGKLEKKSILEGGYAGKPPDGLQPGIPGMSSPQAATGNDPEVSSEKPSSQETPSD